MESGACLGTLRRAGDTAIPEPREGKSRGLKYGERKETDVVGSTGPLHAMLTCERDFPTLLELHVLWGAFTALHEQADILAARCGRPRQYEMQKVDVY